MTLQEVNDKIKKFNDGLEQLITEFQLYDKLDKKQLTTVAGAIERVILNDPVVKKILLNGDPEQRKEYMDAIKAGMDKSSKILEDYHEVEADRGRIADISDVAKNSNKNTKTIITNIEKIDKDDEQYTYSNQERIKDLEDKISKVDFAINVAKSFEDVKNAMVKAGGSGTVKEAITEAEKIENEFKTYQGKAQELVNLEKSGNFAEMFEQYKSIRGSVNYDLKDSKTQELLAKMKKTARLIDYVDGLNSSANHVNTAEDMPNDFKNQSEVDAWMSKLNAKLNDPDNKIKLDASLPENKEFIKDGKKLIREQFAKKLEASPVHKNLEPEIFKNIADFRITDLAMKRYLENTTEKLKAYEKVSGKTPADLARYKAEGEKLLEAYKVEDTPKGKITLNNKTRTFNVDMSDLNKKEEALDEIYKLPKEDEFRGEFENRALALAGVKPKDRWFHKFARFISFGRYKTPEDKYAMNLESKRHEVVDDLMTQYKNLRDESKESVDFDKNSFKVTAREEVVNNKSKNFDKKKVMEKREDKDTLTR